MLKQEILEILENDAKLTAKEIAIMINQPEKDVEKTIKEMEDEQIIVKYITVTNKEKLAQAEIGVEALIEVNVRPERGKGFDSIAERLHKFPEIKSLYLMSGGYDLLVVIQGTDLKNIASFVYQKLATIADVTGTRTHFLLKKYKENGVILTEKIENERLAVTP